MKRKSLAACVVLYNPPDSVINNVESYRDHVDKVIVVCNSIISNELFNKFKKLKFLVILNPENFGIAKALNIGCEKAIDLNFKWVLTMDQDSHFEKKSLVDYISEFNNIKDDNEVSIIGPRVITQSVKEIYNDSKSYEFVEYVITSGSLINLEIFQKIGEFRADFFIDYVDVEYCLKSRAFGYKVVLLNNIFLKHQLGDEKIVHGIKSTHHSALRRYFITRNRILVWRLYWKIFPVFCLRDLWRMIKEAIKIILVESEKKRKLSRIITGIKDGIMYSKSLDRRNNNL